MPGVPKLFPLILIILLNLSAQNFKLSEAIYSYWSDGNWVLSSRNIFEYDVYGNISGMNYNIRSDGSWSDYMKYEYHYDTDERISLIEIIQFSDNVWKDYMKIDFFYSPESSEYETVTTLRSSSGWDNYARSSYSVNENGKLASSKTDLWSDSLWTDYSRMEYTYNGAGETDEYFQYLWEDSTWNIYFRFDYLYNAQGLNYLSNMYTWSDSWNLEGRDDNSFDENKNMILSITQSYTDGNWTNQSKSEYSYIEFTGLTEPSSPLAAEIELYQNYPNPFNPETEISFFLKKDSFITVDLFNTSGQLIKTVFNGKQPAGHQRIKIDASDLESGIYFYTLRSGNDFITKKMTLIK